MVEHLKANPNDFGGGFGAWCEAKQVCRRTCDRYRALATRWGQVRDKAKAGDAEAVDLHRRLIDDGHTPTVVAAERLLGIGVKDDAIPETPSATEPKEVIPKAEKTAKQRVESFAAKVNDLVNDMGWIEVELYSGRVTPDDIAAPLDRLIREATELRTRNPFAGPAKREEAAEAAKPAAKPKATKPAKPKPVKDVKAKVAPSKPKKANGPSVARRGRPQGDMIFNEDGE
jgi:hypothetical protein